MDTVHSLLDRVVWTIYWSNFAHRTLKKMLKFVKNILPTRNYLYFPSNTSQNMRDVLLDKFSCQLYQYLFCPKKMNKEWGKQAVNSCSHMNDRHHHHSMFRTKTRSHLQMFCFEVVETTWNQLGNLSVLELSAKKYNVFSFFLEVLQLYHSFIHP